MVAGASFSSRAQSPAKGVLLLCEDYEILSTLGQCNLLSPYPKEGVFGGFSFFCLLRKMGY